MLNKISTPFTEILDIRYPIIMAPMFLVTNELMCIEAARMGIAPCIPALNWRTPELMRQGIRNIKKKANIIGVNLITNSSNIYYKKHLEICVEEGVDFVITSLGSPKEVIEKCKPKNIKVFCDVIDVAYAKKCEELGADALIAVSQEAGGHFGPIPARELIALLKSHTNLPIISAGGIGSGQGIWERIHQDQVIAVSIGSIFIASEEAPISQEYKQACVDYKAEDIVTTTKISGSPLSVINTDYVKKIGTEQNLIEKWLSKSKRLKKYVKMFTMYMGMRKVQKAAFSATYQNVWVAGKSIDFIHSIRKVSDIIAQLIEEYENYNKKNSALKQQN